MRPRRIGALAALGGACAVSACAVPPPVGPSIMALPGDNQSLEQFQRADFTCRAFAQGQTGDPALAAQQSAVGSAAVGTVVGAAAGALIGAAAGNPGAGAAIGAGTGLLGGTAVGAQNAQLSAGAMQQRYDISYAQCMVAQGQRVPISPWGGPGVAYAAMPMVASPVVAPPVTVGIGVGVGGGWGWGGPGWGPGWGRPGWGRPGWGGPGWGWRRW